MRGIGILVLFLLLGWEESVGQQSQNVKLLCNWQDTTNSPVNALGQYWNDVWGFSAHGREYAVIGGTRGAHIIDVNTCQELVFLNSGTTNVIHRDYKTYRNYLYCVADEDLRSTMLVYDLSVLPDTPKLVWTSDRDTINRTHNIFIDSARAKLYCASATGFNGQHDITIFSLANPAAPKFLANIDEFDKTHDIYVRNDTAWCSNSWQGYLMVDMSTLPKYKVLGGLLTYPHKGYNHSSWVGYDNIAVMADETFGKPIKVVDTRNPLSMEVRSSFGPRFDDTTSIPHNPYLLGKYAFISYYLDGLQIYDISDPFNPKRAGYYDTYGGPDGQYFAGAWGCFPYLPSRKILVSDMQSGLYVFDADEAMNIRKNASFNVLSVAGRDKVVLQLPLGQTGQLRGHIYDMSGRLVAQLDRQIIGEANPPLPVSLGTDLAAGIYVLRATLGSQTYVARFVKW